MPSNSDFNEMGTLYVESSGENNMAKVMDARASYSLFVYQFTYSKLGKLGTDFQTNFRIYTINLMGHLFIYRFLLYFCQIHKYILQREGEHLGLNISKFNIFSSDKISS